MPEVIKAEITALRELGGSYLALDLSAPGIAEAAGPGQFVMARADGSGNDPITPRPLSIFAVLRDSGLPTGITLLIKVLGRGTCALARLGRGDAVSLNGPLGRGLELDGRQEYLLVAGGTGVAPAAFAAQELERLGAAYSILYGGASSQALHLGELQRHGIDALVCTEDGSTGQRGLVTELLEQRLACSGAAPQVFACGPWRMMREATRICRERGLDCLCSLERYMACGYGACLSCVYKSANDGEYRTCCKEGPVVSGLEVDWDA